MKKEKVCLFGASGTMGHEALKELWSRRDKYDIVLLLRPSENNKNFIRKYEEEVGTKPIPGKGVAEGGGLKILWGDAANYADVEEAIRGTDWVLDAMAMISPQADYYPELAKKCNTDGIRNIVRAIEAQPDGAEHIRLAYTGTIASIGDRLQSIHWGRMGDPLKPSIFDYYAVTKIAGERAVLESNIKHWVSLRLTFIMPSDFSEFFQMDPIMFHQPIDSFMENITARDAGYGLVRCLDIAGDSDFWRKAYHMAGGPRMRILSLDLMNRGFQLNGLSGVESCSERKWFALRNFHMEYYEDSDLLNGYLHHWRDTLDSYWEDLASTVPPEMQQMAAECRKNPELRKQMEQITYETLKNMAENNRNGTVYWYKNRRDMRITAFFNNYETFDAIPDWGVNMPQVDPEPAWHRLDHGYDESKKKLALVDLQGAARFRGGQCLAQKWSGDMYESLRWECSRRHAFTGKPYTILKAGHSCPDCAPPPWNYDDEARRNPFFAQVWYPNHDKDENNFYPADCIKDISCADKD